MKILSRKQVLENMSALPYCLHGNLSSITDVKQNFISALNSIQKVRFDCSNKPMLSFRNDELVSGLVRSSIFSEKDVTKDGFLANVEQQKEIESKYEEAWEVISSLDRGLYEIMNLLISTVFCCNVARLGGGSVTSYISVIWLSPKPEWTKVDYAENLVHEFVHNSLFLDDMVHNVFPDHLELSSSDAMVTSSILKRKRHFDKSFHAACVSIALMYFYYLLGDTEKVDSFYPSLVRTVEELIDRDSYVQSQNRTIISSHGREILSDMARFIRNPYYEEIHSSLNYWTMEQNQSHEDIKIPLNV